MTGWVRPIPRGGRADRPAASAGNPALPLAGSRHFWFDAVQRRAADGTVEMTRAADLRQDLRDRLSAPRPMLCGLSLDRPRIMGIVNVTPDSFSDGGDRFSVNAALAGVKDMLPAADVLDIGGESTRPGATPVPVAEEIARIVPVIRAIRGDGIATPISVDTRKAAVAAAALEAGADMVNDVSALSYDAQMAAVVAERGVPVCLMHSQGEPQTMQDDPRYDDALRDVFDALLGNIARARDAGIAGSAIVADPGIGFGKTQAHNLAILSGLSLFHDIGVPLLLGASRKRFIGMIGKAPLAKDRLAGSVAVALHGMMQGAHIVRVHDVSATRQAIDLFLAASEGEWDEA